MFYIKKKIDNDIELRVDLYDDEIYTKCPKCGKEINVETEDLKLVLKEGDLSSSTLYCEECSK